jgi:hypothetical protein
MRQNSERVRETFLAKSPETISVAVVERPKFIISSVGGFNGGMKRPWRRKPR